MTTAGQRTELDVRPAVRADLLDVFRIEKRSFEQPWPYAAFEQFLGSPGFLVAEAETVVGYVVVDTVGHSGDTVGHIKDLAVSSNRRHEGIGRTLLAEGLTALVADGVSRVKLEVRPSNDAARSLYGAFGFETHHVRHGYYADGEDAHVMVKLLV